VKIINNYGGFGDALMSGTVVLILNFNQEGLRELKFGKQTYSSIGK